jgi:hypothetical protein
MGRLSHHGRRIRAGLTLALLVSMLAAPIVAFADSHGDDDGERRTQSLNCPGRETLVRVDEATCPANKNRPLIVRKRACCQNPQGRVHCDHFEHCPNESPS